MSDNGNFSTEISSSDYEKVKEIFSTAIELAPDARAEFLDEIGTDDEMRREVESLLSAYEESENFLKDVSAVEIIQDSYNRNNKLIGQKIDKYRIKEEIG